MKHLKLIITLLTLLFVNQVHATLTQNVNTTLSQDKTSQDTTTEFVAYLQKPEWMLIKAGPQQSEFTLHLPRVHNISEVTWSDDHRYLSFTTKGREHWLLDVSKRAIRLVDSTTLTADNTEFLPQWSPDGRWLLFISHQQTQSRPRVYSIEKKRSYALPITSEEYLSIAWERQGQAINVVGFMGNTMRIAAFKSLGISLKLADNNYLAALPL